MTEKEAIEQIKKLCKQFNYWRDNLTDASLIFEQIEELCTYYFSEDLNTYVQTHFTEV